MRDVGAYVKSRRASRRALVSVVAAVIMLTLLLFDARVAVGQGSASAEPQRESTSKVRDTTPPSRPTRLAVSRLAQNRWTLKWNASTDNVGIAGYDLYRNGTKMTTVTTTSASQTGRLTCGRSFVFAVVARDAAGNSSKKGQLRVSTSACAVPDSPSVLRCELCERRFWCAMDDLVQPGFTWIHGSRADRSETGTADGRVTVAAPPGSAETAARFELRDPIRGGRSTRPWISRKQARILRRPSTRQRSASAMCGGSRRGSTSRTRRARNSSGRTAAATRSPRCSACTQGAMNGAPSA